jgi:predicted DNA repair protein MutK
MATSLLLLLDDIASVLDDVATMTKVAATKTAGVVGDDLAVNAKQVAGVHPERELAVVWRVAVGSAFNKVILVPAALAISWLAPWTISPLLVVGGTFLCYEGAEKLLHAFQHRRGNDSRHPQADGDHSPVGEAAKISGAIRTDFILSAEIIVITLGVVAGRPLATQVGVLVVVAVLMTLGVYGLVAAIVKLDDLGLWLVDSGNRWARGVGRGVVTAAAWLMRGLAIGGTAAMFLVGGGIVVHQVPAVHHVIEQVLAGGEAAHSTPPSGVTLLAARAAEAVFGVGLGIVVLAIAAPGKKFGHWWRKQTA